MSVLLLGPVQVGKLDYFGSNGISTCTLLSRCRASRTVSNEQQAASQDGNRHGAGMTNPGAYNRFASPRGVAGIGRREFVLLAAAAVAACPFAAHAQQSDRMRRIGILQAYRPSDAVMQARVQALQQELHKLGWTKGVNIQFDERWTTDDMELVRANAANLVELNPDVIITGGGRVVPIFIELTSTIPIILPGTGDPVQQGWVPSLARPGGNITGFTFYEPSILGKMLEILQQFAPGTTRVVVIFNPDNAANAYALRLSKEFARSLGIEPVLAPFHGIADLQRALEPMANQGNAGILSIPDLTVYQLRVQIAALATRYRMPAIYSDRIVVTSGGLVSYDADRIEIYRRAASYVDRVLRGEKPGDLPFQQPTKYQLTINLKTAKALGLDLPDSLLARADEVLE
jgi:putative tryptophan/tyrosine transport system substrate-binding protein